MTSKNLIFITGPEGCGKTTNGPKLADYFGCKYTIDGIDSSAIGRLLNMLGDGEKVLVLSAQSAGIIRSAFPDSSIHNFFDAMREARLVVAPQWRIDQAATARNQKETFSMTPHGPTLAVLGEIQGERQRQQAKGFDASSDDRYTEDELPRAAIVYALKGNGVETMLGGKMYPWAKATFKCEGRRANLVKAAALLVAEIERLDRAAGIAKAGVQEMTKRGRCEKAPAGYQCTRHPGHDGPCAAVGND